MTPGEMPAHDLVIPNAAAMIEALRALGYSTPTAIADIIDNSISADASTIQVHLRWAGEGSRVTIVDNGRGMSTSTLVEAMRTGGRNPLELRDQGDLGRFSMGLKTASFSQCRRLTVASRMVNGELTVRRWDIDHVTRVGQWQLLHGFDSRTESTDLVPQDWDSGTAVVWEHLDRIMQGGQHDRPAHQRFLELTASVYAHLAVVFGRFITQHRLKLSLNGRPVQAWDPFISDDPATLTLPLERLGPEGGVRVQGHILPHPSRLSPEHAEVAAGPGGWIEQQGFYVYRNDRLLVMGGWLGLGYRREDQYRLARISVDLPNTMDTEWDIDIRKSRARPPGTLRDSLQRYADLVRSRALKVYHQRGKLEGRSSTQASTSLWITNVMQNRVHQRIAREHPLVDAVRQTPGMVSGTLEVLLLMLERTVPVERIWVDSPPEHQGGVADTPETHDDFLELLQKLITALRDSGLSQEETLVRLGQIEPFHQHPTLLENLRSGRGLEHKL